MNAMLYLKNNKAPEYNGITVEFIKEVGERLQKEILKVISEVWEKEKIPQQLGEVAVRPIHKKGYITDCKNYKGITLRDTVYKILTTLIRYKIKDKAKKYIKRESSRVPNKQIKFLH